jgi:beta-lactamase superfamily II metal-dependent hydrolase
MPTDVTKLAEERQKGYRFTNKLISKVYDKPYLDADGNRNKRSTVANLFAGEWTKHLGDVGGESEIYFRGGRGYINKDALGSDRVMELYFIDVGQGDSILVQTPDDRRILIDGGEGRSALSFLRWKYRLNVYYKVFDAVVMTHGDSDHMRGLIHVLNDPHVIVKAVYHSGIAKKKDGLGATVPGPEGEELVELYSDVEELALVYDDLTYLYRKWVDAVRKARRRAARHKEPFTCERVDHNTGVVNIGGPNGVKMRFLGPVNVGSESEPRLITYKSEGKTVNGNSVALRLEYGKARVLLCGDMHDEAELKMLDKVPKSRMKSHVFKANHHGSQYFTSDFLNAVDPWVSVVSSGNYDTHGHPRANLLGSLGRYAPRKIKKPILFSTELSATFKKISKKKIDDRENYLYERRTYGLINVRTDGDWLATGRVYGKTTRKNDPERSKFKWEAYAFKLETGGSLLYNLK